MLFAYSILYTIGFVLMLPAFLLNRQKYASGFRERLGNYQAFKPDEGKVIWLHCVSVGETNAARPLVDKLLESFPDHRLVISTTTKTGQELARKIFAEKADAVFYFPFDWKFTVRRALDNFKPSLLLLMETEIWPRFIHEAKLNGVKVAIVNGRLSENSFRRYSKVSSFIARVLNDIDLAVMQGAPDAKRIAELGMAEAKIDVTSNLKFEMASPPTDYALTEEFRERFGVSAEKPLIVAASTHEPEERLVIESLEGELGHSCRLLIAPRHPERFNTVAELLSKSVYKFVRRTDEETSLDKCADVILLDTIGELRALYPLAEIVFVGGSLIRHGGQSIIEPASQGKAIVTGPFTTNFDAIVKEFLDSDAILQIPEERHEYETTERLYEALVNYLLEDAERRSLLGRNAMAVFDRSNRDASQVTIDSLKRLLDPNKLKSETLKVKTPV